MSIAGALLLSLEAFTFGHGNSTCGQWIEAREKQSVQMVTLQAWVAGYLTGVSQMTDRDPTQGARTQDVFLWLDNQCRSNPTGSLHGAVLRFIAAQAQR